jgi:hypothetical protein
MDGRTDGRTDAPSDRPNGLYSIRRGFFGSARALTHVCRPDGTPGETGPAEPRAIKPASVRLPSIACHKSSILLLSDSVYYGLGEFGERRDTTHVCRLTDRQAGRQARIRRVSYVDVR